MRGVAATGTAAAAGAKELRLSGLGGSRKPRDFGCIMMIRSSVGVSTLCAALSWQISAAVITVNTTNNVSPTATETSLVQALRNARDGDEIRFGISGAGPHYIATP